MRENSRGTSVTRHGQTGATPERLAFTLQTTELTDGDGFCPVFPAALTRAYKVRIHPQTGGR
jgi:hypothetical protein